MSTNAKALSRLLTSERSALVRWAARFVGEPSAEDVAQSLYLRVQGIKDDPPITNKRSFLFRLTRNLAVDHARSQQRYDDLFDAEVDASEVPSSEPSAETRLIDRQRLDHLTTAVGRMPLRCRQVFVLIKFDELSVAEVAERLGISQDMVRKHIRHALQLCQQSLSDQSA